MHGGAYGRVLKRPVVDVVAYGFSCQLASRHLRLLPRHRLSRLASVSSPALRGYLRAQANQSTTHPSFQAKKPRPIYADLLGSPQDAAAATAATQERTSSPTMAHAGDMAVFYEAWVGREEEIVADLTAALPACRQELLAPLVDAAVDHVASYYENKSRLADRDVVAALDPRWLNPLERTFLWAWGWKPALVFRFVDGDGVGSHQRRALEDLRVATAAAEQEVDREVAAVQESLAGPRVLAALRHQPPRNGEAVAAVGRSLRVLLAAADALRERTVRGVVGVLAPEQAGAFVAAMLRFHLGVRRAGRVWSSGHGGRWAL